MSAPPGADGDRDGGPGPPRLRREPRPYLVHVAVDAVIAFVATVFLLWLFGVPLWAMIAVAWILGLIAAPFTRKWEQRQLDERGAPAAPQVEPQ